MKQRERQLVIAAALVFVVVLAVRVIPGIVGFYQQGRDDIALLEERIDRYRALALATDEWRERELLKSVEISELESWVYSGSDANLIGNSVQRSLRSAAELSGVEVREMNVARYSKVDNWMMVTQEMSFTTDQDDILPLLGALQELRPRLFVQAFTVTRSRRQYSGNIVVAGFGRVATGEATP